MFVVEQDKLLQTLPDVIYIKVKDTKLALQQIAAFYRQQFNIPIIGITGSNGKTIVKEWLYQLLQGWEDIALSPRSYNSQIGVPLSIFQLETKHSLGIFEAGISTRGEMKNLVSIIKPTIGILTNIGHAHDAGFESLNQKFEEKSLLFSTASIIISSSRVYQEFSEDRQRYFLWGEEDTSDVIIRSKKIFNNDIHVELSYKDNSQMLVFPFVDQASFENLMTCISVIYHLGYPTEHLQEKILELRTIPMRMTIKKLGNEALLIDDTYSADIGSLKIALDYLQSLDLYPPRTLVISDFDQTGVSSQTWLKQIFQTLEPYKVDRLIGIGKEWYLNKENLPNHQIENVLIFEEVNEAIQYLRNSIQLKEIILLKGARNYSLDRITRSLEFQSHETRLEVNFQHLIENVQYIKKQLKSGVKLMGMVKAFSYGTGSYEIAKTLIRQGVDYLTVAYLDEGVELRNKGIQTPIMVMNVETHSLERLVEYNLEPVVYSPSVLQQIITFLKAQDIQKYPVHIELETGMNRLGMNENEIIQVLPQLCSTEIEIKSVFSHLVGSEDPIHDEFTLQQFEKFNKIQGIIAQAIPYRFLKHILNSNGILRHPSLQLDMVRLGIGMYGIFSDALHKKYFKPVVSLLSTIAQIKELSEGESVSYGRRSVANKKTRIATIRVGYADGYPRALGNGKGKVWINGKFAPIIGTICMDMLMVDISNLDTVKEGDTVELWGENISLEEVSEMSGTIPYEILTSVNSRVKRVYITG